MTNEKFYLTPLKKTRIRFTIRGSRFIATLTPVADEETASKIIDQVGTEFHDATHHAYACRVGSGSAIVERSSDAREPAGTAGAPMLQILQGSNVSDALVIGTRYFGGTRLGIGGLTRAYRDCARLALEDAVLRKKEPFAEYSLKIAYEELGALTRLVETLEGTVLGLNYSDSVIMHVQLPARESEAFKQGFNSICRGRGVLKEL